MFKDIDHVLFVLPRLAWQTLGLGKTNKKRDLYGLRVGKWCRVVSDVMTTLNIEIFSVLNKILKLGEIRGVWEKKL